MNDILIIPYEQWLKGYSIDVSNFIEKKNNLDYISWATSEKLLRENFPNLIVDFERDSNGNYFFGNPDIGYFVLPFMIDVKENKRTKSLYYPIIDYRNQSIKNLTSMAVNTSLQRARSKIIALETGIGFSLYTGEDLIEQVEQKKKPIQESVEQVDSKQVDSQSLEKLRLELSKIKHGDVEVLIAIKSRWEKAKAKLSEKTYLDGIETIKPYEKSV
jgi:hypothetical protein